MLLLAIALTGSACQLGAKSLASADSAFRIQLIDQSTGRGVPAVELRTNDQRRFVSDNLGVIAFFEPDLMDRRVYFQVRSFGYRLSDADPISGGIVLEAARGGRATVALFRENVATRLYRVTGSGRQRESELLGSREAQRVTPMPLADPVLGLDSALCTTYRDALFFVFGDTVTAANPLANYRASAARTPLPESGDFDPRRGLPLEFLTRTQDGAGPPALRPMVADPHPVIWLSGLRVVPDAEGDDRLFATYSKIAEGMQVVENGLAELSPERGQFVPREPFPDDAGNVPMGHAYRHTSGGVDYVYFDLGLRVPLAYADTADLDRYEAFTPLRRGSGVDAGPEALERDAGGELVWAWKRSTAAPATQQWRDWIEAGHVRADEGWLRLIDVETGREVVPHNGSVRWNPHRRRWVMVRTALGGESLLGEVYYAEADTPLGPWAYARKVATHAWRPGRAEDAPAHTVSSGAATWTLSYYNPVHCPELDLQNGRQILFQGTLSTFLTSPENALPGYDYNQLMYALDLDDPRLRLPVAIYRRESSDGDVTLADPGAHATAVRFVRYDELEPAPPAESTGHTRTNSLELSFFAPDRFRPGTIPVFESPDPERGTRLIREPTGALPRFFCAESDASPQTVPLFESLDARGRWQYALGATPDAEVLCHVWPAPIPYPDAVRSPAP